MGGKYASEKLRGAGLDVSKATTEAKAWPQDLHVLEVGHPLHDPRSLWPLEESFVAALDEGLCLAIVTVRQNGAKDLQVIDGTRTTLHLHEVNKRRATRGGKPPLRALLRFVEGDDQAMRLLRLQLNAERRSDNATSLAHKFAELYQAGAGTSAETIAAASNVSTETVLALLRFSSFAPEVRRALDVDLPPEAAIAFADIPREDHAEVLASVMGQLGHLPPKDRTPRKVKAAVKEATGKKGKPPAPRMLTRAKLERVRDACAADVTRSGDDTSTAAFVADFCRFVMGEADALDQWREVKDAAPLLDVIGGALAPQKPGRKPAKET